MICASRLAPAQVRVTEELHPQHPQPPRKCINPHIRTRVEGFSKMTPVEGVEGVRALKTIEGVSLGGYCHSPGGRGPGRWPLAGQPRAGKPRSKGQARVSVKL